jgi:uncharacterized protein YcgI (DUF1989 family)
MKQMYEEVFSDAEIGTVLEQAMIYMCACPAQVAATLRTVRELHRYQQRCMASPKADKTVHLEIEKAAAAAHAVLQDCLLKIIDLEGWDRNTLQMPDGLREYQLREINDGT